MTRTQAQLVGHNLAKHNGEWVVLDDGKVISHAPRLKDAVAAVPKNVKHAAVYYSSADEAEMVCASL